MSKIITIMSKEKLRAKYTLFKSQMLMMRLVNSGASYSSLNRNNFTKQAFDTAYEILSDLSKKVSKQRIDMFNSVYFDTKELVIGPYVTPEMEALKTDFYTKISELVKKIAVFMANNCYTR